MSVTNQINLYCLCSLLSRTCFKQTNSRKTSSGVCVHVKKKAAGHSLSHVHNKEEHLWNIQSRAGACGETLVCVSLMCEWHGLLWWAMRDIPSKWLVSEGRVIKPPWATRLKWRSVFVFMMGWGTFSPEWLYYLTVLRLPVGMWVQTSISCFKRTVLSLGRWYLLLPLGSQEAPDLQMDEERGHFLLDRRHRSHNWMWFIQDVIRLQTQCNVACHSHGQWQRQKHLVWQQLDDLSINRNVKSDSLVKWSFTKKPNIWMAPGFLLSCFSWSYIIVNLIFWVFE